MGFKKLTATFLLATTICISSAFAQKISSSQLKEGDLIFQDINCDGLCNAIKVATYVENGLNFNHTGIVIQNNENVQVLEAIWPSVQISSLDSFLSRSPIAYVSRPKKTMMKSWNEVKSFLIKQINVPYDVYYLADNDLYYCTEIINEGFKKFNSTYIIENTPMSFKNPITNHYLPEWEDHFSKLGVPIPEGEPGCNPTGMYHSKNLIKMGQLK